MSNETATAAGGAVGEKPPNNEEQEFKRRCGYYHGLLPREDIPYLLVNHGDFILRTSEVDSPGKETQEITVISALIDHSKESANKTPQERASMNCNVIIRRSPDGGKLHIEQGNTFGTLEELMLYYREHVVRINKKTVELLNPIDIAPWEYYHENILSKGKKLGAGAFGEVLRGEFKTKKGEIVPVAIKQLKQGNNAAMKAKIQECMAEARLHRELNHKNVVRMYGVIVMENPIAIILELVPDGALDSYLVKKAGQITLGDKLEMTLGAAMGLTYLHSQMVLHRDVAARNCLYDRPVVKIADFGLSKKGTTYKMKTSMKLPIRWMAPESIQHFTFSQKTDVYSCGILIYEIFSLKNPYDGQPNRVVKELVIKGQTLDFPPDCPEVLATFIKQKVWALDPEERASMKDIADFVEPIVGRAETENPAMSTVATALPQKIQSQKVVRKQSKVRARGKNNEQSQMPTIVNHVDDGSKKKKKRSDVNLASKYTGPSQMKGPK